jgi:hypothetical protein
MSATRVGVLDQLRAATARRILSRLPPPLLALVDDEKADYAIGIGPNAGGGLLVAGGLGAGLFLHRGGLGYYGSLGWMAGLVGNVSLGVHVTVVKGGAEAFLGLDHAVSVSVAPALASVTLLYTPEHRFIGASVGWGVGQSFPLEACVGVFKTYGRG